MDIAVFTIICLFARQAFVVSSFSPVPPANYLTAPPVYKNSEPTTIVEFPWHAYVNVYKKDGKWYGCNGSILSTAWVMTAAHCFTEERFEMKVVVDVKAVKIFTGLTNRDWRFRTDNYSHVQENGLLEGDLHDYIKIHKEYKKYVKNNNDIALVKLKQHLHFNPWVQPITLATTADAVVGKLLTVTGWGEYTHNRHSGSQLMKIEGLHLVSQSQCKAFWERDGKSRITDNMICHWSWKKITCRGYSGGPVVTGLGSSSGPPFVQIGIVSWGHKYCERSTPDVFVNVAKYRTWINNITVLEQN